VTKLSFTEAYAERFVGSEDDAFKMPTSQQLDDDLQAGHKCKHPNGLPLLPRKAQGAPVDLKLINRLVMDRHRMRL
jgi:hypothetical protein